MDKDVNIRGKTTKPLEKNVDINFCDFGFGKSSRNKEKIYKLNFIKIENFCT